ncbi:MAG TPA: IPT/TIG domain-containing protein, partial [Acidimicrobiales bacterium]
MAFTRIRQSVMAVTLLAATAISATGLLTALGSSPAQAATPDTGASTAYGINVKLFNGNVLGPLPQATLGSAGQDSTVMQTLPVSVPGLITANTLNATADSTNYGTAGEVISAAAGTEGLNGIPGISLLGPTNPLLNVTAVNVSCFSTAEGSAASTQIIGLSIDGTAPANIPEDPAPNTGLTAAQLGPLAGLITLTLNKQTSSDTHATGSTAGNTSVNVIGLQITLLSGLDKGVEIDVSQAACSANGSDIEAPPTVTGLSPKFGPIAGGTAVTITGTEFYPGSTVSFGGTTLPAASVDVVSPTEIIATDPAHAAGPVNVNVTNGFGTSGNSANNVFTYENAPTVTSFTPLFGPTAGGTLVTITGGNYVAGDVPVVTFGGNPGTNTTEVSPTELTTDTPAGAAGPVAVVVTDGGGTVTAAQPFTYVAPPLIDVTGLSPLFGPVAGGTLVTITGENFDGPTTVDFGGTAGTNVTVVSSTEITVDTPAHIAGA